MFHKEGRTLIDSLNLKRLSCVNQTTCNVTNKHDNFINVIFHCLQAFGATEAMTDRICIQSNGAKQVHLSAEDLATCCSSCGYGCNGGFPESAWEYFRDSGIVTGGPYNSNEGCQPYQIPACDHHVPGSKNPCHGELPTPECKHTCREGYYCLFLFLFWLLQKDTLPLVRLLL